MLIVVILRLKAMGVRDRCTYYRKLLTQIGYDVVYIIVARRPSTVVDGLVGTENITPDHATLVWLRYMLDAERASREYRRIVMPYDSFLSNWRATLGNIAEKLDLGWSQDFDDRGDTVDQLISLEAKRQGFYAVSSASETIHKWSEMVFGALIGLAESDNLSESDFSTLEAVEAEFSAFSNAFGVAMYNEVLAQRKRHQSVSADLHRRISELDGNLRSLLEADVSAVDKIDQLESKLDQAESERRAEAEKAQALESEFERISKHLLHLDGVFSMTAQQVGFQGSGAAAKETKKKLRKVGSKHNTPPSFELDDVSRLMSTLLDKAHELEKITAHLSDAHVQIAELEKLREQDAELNLASKQAFLAENTELSEEVESLKRGKSHIAKELMQIVENKTIEAQSLEAEQKRVLAEIASLRASTSWRATAPIRWAMNRVKRR